MKAGPLISLDPKPETPKSEASSELSAAEPRPVLPGITLRAEPFSRGPLAAIYRGWDRVHRCDVVVKVQRATDDPVVMNRFQREAAVMLRLRHPSIVSLYATHEGNPPALIMEYVPGPTLAALVAADGRLSPERAAKITEEIAAALDCVHAVGIVHRDVKPSNILLPRRGPAKLTDFGVARIDDDVPLTVMGDILGTIEYASPEQVHGNGAIDTRSDVYSLAAVSYFMLTGTPPFRAADNSTQAQLSVMHRQVFAEPPPLRLHRDDLTPAMEEAVLRGLAKAPGDRYASAGQLAAALRAAVVAASGEPQQSAMAISSRRTSALAGAFGAAVLLLAGIALWKTSEDRLHPAVATAPVPMTISRPVPAVQAVQPKTPTAAPLLPKRAAQKSAAPKTAAAVVPHPAKTAVAAVPIVSAPVVKLQPTKARPQTHLQIAAVPKNLSQNSERRPLAPNSGGTRLEKARLAKIALLHRSLTPPELGAVRHSELTSKHPPVQLASRPSAPKQGWLLVFAKQNTAALGKPSKIAAIPAQSVTVDGKPAPALAAGHWIAVPAGQHWVSFYPHTQSGFGPRTRVPITVAPGAHVGRQVLLAAAIVPQRPAVTPSKIVSVPSKPAIVSKKAAQIPPRKTDAVGWYTVSGWIALTNQSETKKPELVLAAAQWIKVDGKPLPSLALGQWAELPAGHHEVVFQPAPGLGVGPKTWAIDLAPSAHLNQQVPLPPAPLPAVPPHLRNP